MYVCAGPRIHLLLAQTPTNSWVLVQSYQNWSPNRNSRWMVCRLGKMLLIQFPQIQNQYLWVLKVASGEELPGRAGRNVIHGQSWRSVLPNAEGIQIWRVFFLSYWDLHWLYKNTTFNLKSPLASLYKHRKCYWALEISFNEGKVFLLKSVIFFLSQHNIFRGAREAGLFWALRKQTNPCLTHDVVTQTTKWQQLREARKGGWRGGNNSDDDRPAPTQAFTV